MPEQVSAFEALMINTLLALGIEYEDKMTYRLTSKYDTQDIPAAAGTEVEFFGTDTSSRTAHAKKEFGCNLREPRKIDEKETFVVLGMGLELVGLVDGTSDLAKDCAKLRDWGYVKELTVDDRPRLRYLPLSAMGMNRGMTIELLGAGAAVDFDMVTTGQPGIPTGIVPGLEFQPFERQVLSPGTDILAVTAVDSPDGDLSAAREARLHLLGVSIKPSA